MVAERGKINEINDLNSYERQKERERKREKECEVGAKESSCHLWQQ